MTRRQFLLAAGLGMLAWSVGGSWVRRAVAAPGTQGPLEWPMFRGSSRHLGVASGTGMVTGPNEKWRFGADGDVEPSPAVGDIDGDGKAEVVISAFGGSFHAVAGDSHGLITQPKWTVTPGVLLWSSPAIGDVDGDGEMEVVVGCDDGNVYVVAGADGRIKWKYPTNEKVRASPTLVDVDGDGRIEIVVSSDRVMALDARSQREKWGFTLQTSTFSSAAVADINGDGLPEVVVGSYDNVLYVLSGPSGRMVWSFFAGNQIESSPAIADIDGDGQLEVVFGEGFISGPRAKGVYALRGVDGRVKWFYDIGVDQRVISSPAVGDVDGDGKPEVVIGSNAKRLYVFDGAKVSGGSPAVKYTFDAGNFIESSPGLGDIDGDGKVEIVVGSHDFHLHVLEAIPGNSQLHEKWTFLPPGANIFFSSPTLADIDGDGLLEIVVGNNNGTLYAFDGTG